MQCILVLIPECSAVIRRLSSDWESKRFCTPPPHLTLEEALLTPSTSCMQQSNSSMWQRWLDWEWSWTRRLVPIHSSYIFPELARCSIFQLLKCFFSLFLISVTVNRISYHADIKHESFLIAALTYHPLSIGLQVFFLIVSPYHLLNPFPPLHLQLPYHFSSLYCPQPKFLH